MRDVAHSICLIKRYQITMRKKIDFLFLCILRKINVDIFGMATTDKLIAHIEISYFDLNTIF